MPGAAAAWPGLMAGSLVKTTLVLGLALLAATAAKKRPAAVRHFILSSALIGLLLLPLLELAPVGWRSPLLPLWMSTPASGWLSPAPSGAPSKGAGPAGSWPSGTPAAAGSEVRFEGRSGPLPANTVLVFSPASRPAGDRQTAAVAPAGSVNGPKTGLLGPVLGGLWAAGLLILLIRLCHGLAGAVRLTSQGTPLDDGAWRALLERFLASVSLRRRVGLKSHPDVAVPLTWGWRRPVILMPDGSAAWTDDERSSALFHELSHVKRADFLVMLLVRASLALFWWNPLGWVVYRELLKEQEIACDELVLRAGIRPSAYAASLLAFRRSAGLRWNPSAALLGIVGRSSFQERLAAILRQKITFREVKMKTKIMLALALIAAVALVGTARPAAGREARETGVVLVETALPEAAAPASIAAPPAEPQTAATAAVVQEKTKEQEKAKEKEAEKGEQEKAVEKKIVVVGREGSPVEITIIEGGQTKKLLLDKTVTITKGKNGEMIILTPEGKEPIVLKGEPLRLEIRGGRIDVGEENEAAEPGEGATVKFFKKDSEKGERVIVLEGKEGKATTVYLTPRHEAGATTLSLAQEGEEGQAWTVARSGKALTLATEADEEMLEKIQALEKQVEQIKAKKLDLSALEDSLKKMESDLKANEKMLEESGIKFDKDPGLIALGQTMRELKLDKLGEDTGRTITVIVAGKEPAGEVRSAEPGTRVKVVTQVEAKNAITVVLSEKGLDREGCERALARLKKDLPKGYEVMDSAFDEKGHSMTVKIAPPEGKPIDKTIVQKLVDLLQSEAVKK